MDRCCALAASEIAQGFRNVSIRKRSFLQPQKHPQESQHVIDKCWRDIPPGLEDLNGENDFIAIQVFLGQQHHSQIPYIMDATEHIYLFFLSNVNVTLCDTASVAYILEPNTSIFPNLAKTSLALSTSLQNFLKQFRSQVISISMIHSMAVSHPIGSLFNMVLLWDC